MRKTISTIKTDRAPGINGILSTMVKNASGKFVDKITELINDCFETGCVPEILQTGKMTLIDKKEPSLEASKKRPLTVSSVFLSIITKIMHKRMGTVCERENLYGFVQYGFRKNRSTTDCVLMILAAIRTAKRKHRSISIAFCDIAKAYDSVCRELLYSKLRSLGIGRRVVSLIRSMYYNDCVRINILDGVYEPL